MNALESINALRQEERDRAIDATRTRIAGDAPTQNAEPQFADFLRESHSKYSPEYNRRMRQLGYVLLAAAFFGSAIRIFLAAFETNAAYLLDTNGVTQNASFVLAILIGISSVLLAETGQVAFTLWESSIEDSASDWMIAALRFGSWACAAFALAANAYVVHPWTHLPDAFAFTLGLIETLLPPVLVMIASNVLKKQMQMANADRHAAQMLYTQAHTEWRTQYEAALMAWTERRANAHQHEDWPRTLANSLRDALRAANRRSYAKLRELTNEDWRVLVLREMHAEDWYIQTSTPVQSQAVEQVPAPQPVRLRPAQPRTQTHSGRSSGTHTGEYDNAVAANADGSFTGTCPYCQNEYVKSSARGAKGALVAHGKRCEARTAARIVPDEPDAVIQAEAVLSEVGDGTVVE